MTTHFSRLLNVNRNVNWAVVNGLPHFQPNVNWDPPTITDVSKAIGRLKNGKAEGLSGVPAECLKNSNEVATVIHQAVTRMWLNGGNKVDLPEAWLEAILVALYKNKGLYQDLDNWRGIVLLDVVSKVVNMLLNDKLQSAGEQIWGEEQHGFRPGKGTTDCIYTMRRLIDEFGMTERPGDEEDRLFVLFVDLKKAFDSCDRKLIWALLRKCTVPENVISLTAAFHDGFGAKVMYQGELGERFPVSTGVRQGCCCGPTLWNYYFFFVMWSWRDKCSQQALQNGIKINYKMDLKIRPRAKFNALKTRQTSVLTDIQYADDTGTFDRDFRKFTRSTAILDEAVSEFGGEISLTKTEWTCVPAQNFDGDLFLRGNELKRVEEFKYLGSVVGSNPKTSFGCVTDTMQRVRKASAAFGRLRGLWHSRLSPKVKGRVFSVCVGSVLLYGSESKTMNHQQMKAMKRFWYGCLKCIKELRWHTRWDNLLTEFGVEDVRMLVKRRAAGLMGHLARMEPSRIPYKCCFGYVDGRVNCRSRKGKIKTIANYYEETTKAMPGITAANWPLQAQDRIQWRRSSAAIELQLYTTGGSFKCACGSEFQSQLALDKHNRNVHSAGVGGNICPHCRKGFATQQGLRTHVGRWCKSKPVAPPAGAEAVPSLDVGGVDLFRCEDDNFICNICGIVRRTHATMSRHINSAHGMVGESAGAVPVPAVDVLRADKTEPDPDPNNRRNVICRKCGNSVSKKNWARHDITCGLVYRCHKCAKEYSRPDSLKRHVVTCSTVPLVCPACGRQDKYPSHARRHRDQCRYNQQ